MKRILLFLAVLALAFPASSAEKTKEVVITPDNQAAHLWKVTHTTQKSTDGKVRHFFECMLRLPGKPLTPWEDEIMAEAALVKNGQSLIRYEPRIWVNARPFNKDESNYSIKLELAESAIGDAEVSLWLNGRGHTDTNFIIRLKDFPKDPEK